MSDEKPAKAPLWREEFSIHTADERYVGRRQFARFLVLTSLAMLAGNVWILVKSLLPKRKTFPILPIAKAGEVADGGVLAFAYPEAHDPCLLLRRGETYVAFSQKCTHLSCAVVWDARRGVLACPCHDGAFSARDGRVLAGPPQRPLPRVIVERRGDRLVAVGIQLEEETA
jgi:arsenite oxidase small subunit